MTASSEPMRGGAPARSRADRTPAKTSTAATFSLVFGVSALVCTLTAILAWAGIILGIIGIIVGIFGLQMAKRPGVTGRGVTIGGLTLSIIALILGLVFIAGVATFLNNEGAVNRLQQQVDDLRGRVT
ncbi:hypothetical protein [Micromonospora avicenniae]|uniref:DUF4190 domain-containing protein n=2 Tax=Micromonospora TaxID=1873 RepID=A0A1N7ETC5_9ACTN|nr:hypothetical protein [Micromonospora avicenniae]SIR91343.1 hypothetical protein SAMN05444858_12718 [Micromonospora avicenniae]